MMCWVGCGRHGGSVPSSPLQTAAQSPIIWSDFMTFRSMIPDLAKGPAQGADIAP